MTSVIFLDVGHGNCSIVRSNDSTAVIDAPTGSTLLETLNDLEVDTVEVAVISHADKDHLAGILSLLTSEKIQVQRVYVNPDSQKTTKVWKDFRVAVAVAEKKGDCEVFTSLSSTAPGEIEVGEAKIDVLCPSAALALTGVGGETPDGQQVTTNTLSAVLRVHSADGGSALLAADMDGVSLNTALEAGTDLTSDILVFPHHGGLPGTSKPEEFALRLLDAVKPTSVVFSNGRGRHDNPKPEIIEPVRDRGCTIACTQLSKRCQATAVDATPYLEAIRAVGRDKGRCCAGSVTYNLSTKAQRAGGGFENHQTFITELVKTPMCRTVEPVDPQ